MARGSLSDSPFESGDRATSSLLFERERRVYGRWRAGPRQAVVSLTGYFLYAGSLGVLLGGRSAWQMLRMRPVVAALVASGATARRVGNAALGSVAGRDLRFELRPGERRAPDQTVVTLAAADACGGLEMDLRPQTASEQRHIATGRAIDVITGDARFDESFVVEAAPAALARATLDARIRDDLLRLHPCRVTLASGIVRFECVEFVRKVDDVIRVVAVLQAIAERGAAGVVGAPPVGAQEPPGAKALTAEREPVGWAARGEGVAAERAALSEARARRDAWRKKRIALAVAVGAALGLAVYGLRALLLAGQ